MSKSHAMPIFGEEIYDKIAAQYGTACYIYDGQKIADNYHEFATIFKNLQLQADICFAVKANGNLAVLSLLAGCGAGADIVSQGEMKRALKAGLRPIIFSGVGKSEAELRFALTHHIDQINIESAEEFEMLASLTEAMGITVNFAIRVNPNINVNTHDKIATGRKGDKFGLPFKEARLLYLKSVQIPTLNPVAVAMHIGSQLLALEPYREAFARARVFIDLLEKEGVPIEAVDIGGGLGIAYQQEAIPEIAAYGALVKKYFADKKITLEPGRRIVGNSGEILTRVINIKQSEGKKFIILDAAMNDLMRPALYQAWHNIVPIASPENQQQEAVDIVGPVCETGDYFAKARSMPPVNLGDLLVIKDCGAYGAVMAGTYNARDLSPEIMVKNGKIACVRKRQTVEGMMALEEIPDWLEGDNG